MLFGLQFFNAFMHFTPTRIVPKLVEGTDSENETANINFFGGHQYFCYVKKKVLLREARGVPPAAQRVPGVPQSHRGIPESQLGGGGYPRLVGFESRQISDIWCCCQQPICSLGLVFVPKEYQFNTPWIISQLRA